MEKDNKFFALVGAPGVGKSALLRMLQDRLPTDRCVFLCDSSFNNVRFSKRVTQIVDEGVHETLPPVAQLSFFWTRWLDAIEKDVLPALRAGKCVFSNGFGGAAFAHAAARARNEGELRAITDIHLNMVENAVKAAGLRAPHYLHIVADESRILRQGAGKYEAMASSDACTFIRLLNDQFGLYSQLTGQTVVTLDGNRSLEDIYSSVLEHIEPALGLSLAA